MLVLLDRAFDATAFLQELNDTGANFLVRSKSTRRPPVLTHLPDGSYLSNLDGLTVRIIDAELTVTGADDSRVSDRYRLITTLLDHRHHPATELVRLYHERWEIEIAYLALRHTILDGHVLRSQDRPGLEQEIWALLTLYQLLRMAMVTAVESRPQTNPDRASFTTALEVGHGAGAAYGVLDENAVLVGRIGQAVLLLLPARRPRISSRKVKSPIPALRQYLRQAPPEQHEDCLHHHQRPRRPTVHACFRLPPSPLLTNGVAPARSTITALDRPHHSVLELPPGALLERDRPRTRPGRQQHQQLPCPAVPLGRTGTYRQDRQRHLHPERGSRRPASSSDASPCRPASSGSKALSLSCNPHRNTPGPPERSRRHSASPIPTSSSPN